MKRKTGVRVLAALLVLLALSGTAGAAGPVNLSERVSLTVRCCSGGVALSCVRVTLYLAAELDAAGELTWAECVRSAPVQLEGLDARGWQRAALAVESFLVVSGAAAAASGETGADGCLTLPAAGPALRPGLYLVSVQPHRQGGFRYEADPFFVLLPGRDARTDAWLYAVTAAPKFRPEPEPEQPETVRRRVQKRWAGHASGTALPESVTVTLLCDGAVWDTVALRAETGWAHTWAALPAGHRWTVCETVPDGYTVLTWQAGETLWVENTPTAAPAPEPEAPSGGARLPQTGQLWWPVPALLGAGLAALCAGRFGRRGGARRGPGGISADAARRGKTI